MITIDSIPHAFTMPIAIAGWLVFCFGAAYADSPPLESFTKPAELVLTLSDDLPQTKDSQLFPDAWNAPNRNNGDKFSASKNQKSRLDMDCGMDATPYGDTGNSIERRLSGECDLKYSY
ncbi:MAG: hypothetical protein ACXV7F_05245 [Methylomonas sp.]